jgi:hypothetical protein
MTPADIAAALDGIEYPGDPPKALALEAKVNRLVIAYGASDDLLELRGAIDDEIGAWEGACIRVDAEGLIPDCDDLLDLRDVTRLRDYFRREASGRAINLCWHNTGEGTPWKFETTIPHATFTIMENGKSFCIGIVFSLDDLGGAS